MLNYFDLHCDTLFRCYNEGISLKNRNLAVNLSDNTSLDNYCQVFAVWISENEKKPYETYRFIVDNGIHQFQLNHNRIEFCTDFKKIELAMKNNKIAALISVEGGSVIERNPERVFEIYNDGVRIFALTWNGKNTLASGSKSFGGLTSIGKKVVNNMNRVGMICDLSHLNRKSYFDVIEYADNVLVSHSNCYSVCKNNRNLKNDQLLALKNKNGILGLCFYPEFLGGNIYDNIYKNISVLLDLEMENNICIGSDFDGGDMDISLRGVVDIKKLYDFLITKNIPENTLNNIFFKNAYDFFDKVLTNNIK